VHLLDSFDIITSFSLFVKGVWKKKIFILPRFSEK